MPKITALGWGADGTNALDPDYFEQQEKVNAERRAEKSVGTSSTKSSKKAAASPKKKPDSGQSPAPTTAPFSKKAPTASGSAGSTAGAGPGDKLPPHPKGPVE
jgi:hypothetical protein